MGQSRPTGMGEWFKGIVSRDSGGLQMIVLGRVFNVSASSLFFLCRRFHIEFLKTPSSAELHFSIALQMNNIVRGLKQPGGQPKSDA